MLHRNALLSTALLSVLTLHACDEEQTSPPKTESVSLAEEIPASSRTILAAATELELFALHPDRRVEENVRTLNLQGYEALGRTTIDGDLVPDLLGEVSRGIDRSDGRAALCFMPRHGIRARHEGRIADLVICYECMQIYVFVDGEKVGTVLTASDATDAVSRIFEAAGLTIDGRPGSAEPRGR